MRLIFLGTPEFAIPTLRALLDSPHEVLAVVTAPDKPKGRGLKVKPPPVKVFAQERGLPVLQPVDLRDSEFLKELKAFRPDLGVVVAFRILPPEVFTIPSRGMINLHASLLPKYRGAAPIQWAIIKGEKETGVTTFFISERVDTGDIILQRKVAIGKEETAGELHDRLAEIGAELVLESLELIEKNQAVARKQEGEVTLAPKIQKEDCLIDWAKDAQTVVNHIRGLSPSPGAFTYLEGKILKIFRAKAMSRSRARGDPGQVVESHPKRGFIVKAGWGLVQILELQLEGKRSMSWEEFLRGHPVPKGLTLGR